jgi:hypothetical protein
VENKVMAKPTLLDMVQEILSNMSSDEVNSIGDTTESLQVANIVKQKFRDLVSRSHIERNKGLFQLTPSTDATLPTLMYVPDGIEKIEWIKYFDSTLANGTTDGYKYVTILPIQQFLDLVLSYNPSEIDVTAYTFQDFTLAYKNAATPSYCTVLSNRYVLFDTYDATLDSTLQASKTMCFGQFSPVFRMEDDFVPELEENQFALLINEAKALAFFELKQMPHAKAEQEIRRQMSSIQRNKSVTGIPTNFQKLPNFGRMGFYRTNNRWWNAPGN